MNTPRTSTPVLIAAMRALARDIESPDGVASAAILEAAERLEQIHRLLTLASGQGRYGDRVIGMYWPMSFRNEVDEAIK